MFCCTFIFFLSWKECRFYYLMNDNHWQTPPKLWCKSRFRGPTSHWLVNIFYLPHGYNSKMPTFSSLLWAGNSSEILWSSVVSRLSCLSVIFSCTFFKIVLLWAEQFQSNLAQSILGWKPFSREDSSEIVNIYYEIIVENVMSSANQNAEFMDVALDCNINFV